MTKEQILKKAMEKAVENGWETKLGIPELVSLNENGVKDLTCIHPIIFSHDFAKAFWGRKQIKSYQCIAEEHQYCQCQYQQAWGYHLQQMVLEEDPIKYLSKFI